MSFRQEPLARKSEQVLHPASAVLTNDGFGRPRTRGPRDAKTAHWSRDGLGLTEPLAESQMTTVLGAGLGRNHLCMGPAVQADDFIRCACVLFSLPTVSYSPRSCPSAQSSATYLVAGKWRVANRK